MSPAGTSAMPVIGRALGRATAACGLALASLFVAFVILRLAPGEPASLRLFAAGTAPDAQSVAALRQAHGLDQSLAAQFLSWLQDLARGEAGHSIATDRPIGPEIAARLPWPLRSAWVAFPLLPSAAVSSAMRPRCGRKAPQTTFREQSRSSVRAFRRFAAALLLFWLLATSWQIVRPLTGGPIERLAGPLLIVALFSMGSFARVSAEAFRRVETTQWFLTALAKGLSRGQALRRHAGGPAILAVLAVLVPELGWAIGGTAIVELVFGIPGLSAYVVEAASARDYAVIQVYLILVILWLTAVMITARLIERRIWNDLP